MTHISKKYFKRLSLSIVFFLCLYLIVILYISKDENSFEAFHQIKWDTYLLVIVLALSNYVLRFFRWFSFVAPMNPDISWFKNLLIYISGFALTTTPAKSGEMIRSVYLASLGITYGKSLAAFFSERLLDVIAVLVLSFVFFSFSFPEYLNWMIFGGLIVIGVFLLFRSQIMHKIIRGKSQSIIFSFTQTVKILLSNQSLVKVFPLSLLAWGLQGMSLAAVVYAFGFEANLFLLMGIYCVSILAGALTFIPGGIGATETAISLLLISIGMEPSLAIMASIIVRAITVWLAVGLGVICMLILEKQRNRAKSQF